MNEPKTEKLPIELSYWECERIALGLIQMARDVPGVNTYYTMAHLQAAEQDLAFRIDRLAEEIKKKAVKP